MIPALLVHRKNILHQPLEISSKVVKGVLRSSAFLAVYVALAWAGPPRLLSVPDALAAMRSDS